MIYFLPTQDKFLPGKNPQSGRAPKKRFAGHSKFLKITLMKEQLQLFGLRETSSVRNLAYRSDL